MQFKKYITLLASALLLFACAKEEFDTPTSTPDGPVTVGFWVGRGDTRTETPNAGFELDAPLGAETTRTHASSFGNNKLSVSWSNGDQVAMWAKPAAATEEDAFTFSNQTFKNWFVSADSQNAYFTTTLDNAMPAENENNEDITYNYCVCYPTPASANGTITTFTIPSTQDGKMGGGADIMMAQGSGIALQSLDSNNDFVVDKPDGYPSFTMKHLIHSLMFYVPAGNNWGFPANETIERIVFTMPSTATGTVTADVKAAAPTLALQTAGSNTIALNLTAPIGPSSGNDLDFAAAAIIPPSTKFGEGDNITIKVYTQTKAASQTISLIGRGAGAQSENMRMAANRVTPVVLNCSNATDRPKISFRIASNNLGEQPYKITLTSADTSTQWKDGDDHIYEYYTGSETSTIATGSGFDIYYDEETISSISGETVTVTYESKSAIVTETITMPAMTNGDSYSMNLNVPWLLYQDFNSISSTNKEVENTTGAALDNYGLTGWSGSRWATDKVFRLATYIGTTALGGTDIKFSRVDSPQLYGIKDGKTAKVRVSFDLGLTRISGDGLWGIGAWDIQAQCYFGTTPYDETNPYPSGGTTAVAGQVGSVNKPTNTIETITDCTMSDFNAANMKNYSYTINCKANTRLSWVNDYLKHKGEPSTKTVYVYIDNIKVQIVSE